MTIPGEHDDVYFWGHKGPYGFLSNFYPCSFVDEEGRMYSCSEQYFMKRKQEAFDANNADLAHRIMNATDPRQIKRLGRQVQHFSEEKWSEMRYDAMRHALFLKFSQNASLLNELLITGNRALYEASPRDKLWGIGYSAGRLPLDKRLYGTNLLGRALMDTRTRLRIKATSATDEMHYCVASLEATNGLANTKRRRIAAEDAH